MEDLISERLTMGRRIQQLRKRLEMTQKIFGETYGIPLANLRQYEIGRTMPPPAVRAYISVIEQMPQVVERALVKIGGLVDKRTKGIQS